ncbi:hypothetical protein AB1286_31845 [Trinickia sp. NRRL B-1857]|uniref:hypothetical protein n=1 Tax=Trinickia sp. NRRL B-1857 TaxID=3162879 RepID=UPI003D2E91CE
MQHTVIAFFDTYPQAEAARDALFAAGLAPADVTLKAKCEPTYATDATPAYEQTTAANEGLLASIERFFESLFESEPRERERAHYAEAVRRGAVMVCVDAATDALAQLTRTTLEAMGPLDVEERASTWSPPADEATRSHSPLEELGLRSSVPTPPAAHRTVYTYARDSATPPATSEAAAERAATEAAATAVAAGSAPGMGAVFTAGHVAATPAPAPETVPPPRPSIVPDEFLQDEESYRGDGPDSTAK